MTSRALLLLLCCSAPVTAQQSLLDRADSLLIAGQYVQARAALADWDRANPATASTESAQRARALHLTARLTTDATQAQELYLTIALSYPTAREAPDALLRLGQSFLAARDPRRAALYLERLMNDYPSAPSRSLGFLWLTRAQIAAGNAALACTTAGTALKSAQPPTADVAGLLAAEERTACGDVTPDPQRTAPSAGTAAAHSAPRADTVSAGANATASAKTTDARYTVQTAAFRDVRSANASAAQLRRNGHDARVAYVEASTLARVRIGRFRTLAEASAEARRLKATGIVGIVVADASRER